MANDYKELRHGITTKWHGDSINYTFLQALPNYYSEGLGYA